MGLQVFILIVCAYILPVLQFSLFKKRKNLDFLLISLYAIAAMISSGDVFVLVVFILAFVGYVIYRKGFHLKKWDWIMLGLLIPVGILSMLLYW